MKASELRDKLDKIIIEQSDKNVYVFDNWAVLNGQYNLFKVESISAQKSCNWIELRVEE